jgi:hypothetical protein
VDVEINLDAMNSDSPMEETKGKLVLKKKGKKNKKKLRIGKKSFKNDSKETTEGDCLSRMSPLPIISSTSSPTTTRPNNKELVNTPFISEASELRSSQPLSHSNEVIKKGEEKILDSSFLFSELTEFNMSDTMDGLCASSVLPSVENLFLSLPSLPEEDDLFKDWFDTKL